MCTVLPVALTLIIETATTRTTFFPRRRGTGLSIPIFVTQISELRKSPIPTPTPNSLPTTRLVRYSLINCETVLPNPTPTTALDRCLLTGTLRTLPAILPHGINMIHSGEFGKQPTRAGARWATRITPPHLRTTLADNSHN